MTLGSAHEPPGPVAPDGSPVEFYRLFPDRGEANVVHTAVPPGCEILELGCGAGRMTHRLVELGHRVVAVDNSPEMLATLRSAETILADIESLDLGRRFPGVVLASYLVNTRDHAQRRAFLDTCARHVTRDGSVLIQRAHPEEEWARGDSSESTAGEARIRTRILERDGNVLHAIGEFSIGGSTWTQEYWSELLDDEAIQAALAESGLVVRRWLGEDGEWLEAIQPG